MAYLLYDRATHWRFRQLVAETEDLLLRLVPFLFMEAKLLVLPKGSHRGPKTKDLVILQPWSKSILLPQRIPKCAHCVAHNGGARVAHRDLGRASVKRSHKTSHGRRRCNRPAVSHGDGNEQPCGRWLYSPT